MGFLDRVKKTSEGKNTKDEASNPDATAARTAHERKIEDVLEVLQIPATFEIPDDVFMPEDIKAVDFDIQVPHGFDEGQVMNFVSQSRQSINFFVTLLKKRNEDVAKLASVIDKLQVDANNLRFENEISKGVNIIPTMDEEELEGQLMEAKLRIRALEDQLRAAAPSGLPVPGADAHPNYEAVVDELSIARNRNASLEEELLTAKSRLALYEDSADDELDANQIQEAPLSDEEYKLLGVVVPEAETPLQLPSQDENVGDFPSIEYDLSGDHDNNSRTLSVYDDDDDDSLEELMKTLRES